MKQQRTVESIKGVLRFPLQDPEWPRRFLIGAGLSLANLVLPLVPSLFVYGYLLRVMRSAVEGEEPTLPKWEDWGGLARDGLQAMVVGLVYLLPALAVMLGGMVVYLLTMFSFMGAGGLAEDSSTVLIGVPAAFTIGMAALWGAMSIGTLLQLAGMVPLPMALGHLAAKGDLGAAFRVREWWPILAADKLGYAVDWVVVAGLTAIGYVLFYVVYSTMVLCALAPLLVIPCFFYVMLVAAVLFGQAYRRSSTAPSG